MATRKYDGAPDPGAPGEDEIVGRVLAGRYRIDGVLDEGGAAIVFRGVHVDLDRPVAVKVIQSVWASDDEVRGRFEREARALAALQHPHIVNLIDYGVDGRAPYLVMELLEGQSLRALLDQHGTIPPERAFGILRQVLRALSFAHERGLLHRDLKPGNVFLQALPDTDDHVKLLDFGLAKFVAATGRDGTPLTRAGTVSGTPAYMAPEQAAGRHMDARTDVYAAGALLFEMLSGVRPFEGAATEIMQQKLVMDPPALGSAAASVRVRPELDQVLSCSLARDPAGRYRDVSGMLAALDAVPQPAVAQAPAGAGPVAGAAAAVGAASGNEPGGQGGGMPKPLLAALVGLPVLGALAVCLIAGIVMLVSGDDDSAEPDPMGTSAGLPDEQPVAEDEPPSAAEGVDAPNPWAEDPAPEPLGRIKDKVDSGERVSGTELRELNVFARDNPDDVRPYLLTGHALVGRGARSSAIGRYEHAWRMDADARGDPDMLGNLVDMALGSSTSERAGRTLERIYGSEALPALDARKRQGELSGPEMRRLQRLRERLRS